MCCLLGLLAGAATVFAGDDAKSTKPEKLTPAKMDKARVQTDKEVELTGSRNKRTVRRSGLITDGPNNLVVIDRGMIDRSGGADMKQALGLQGIH